MRIVDSGIVHDAKTAAAEARIACFTGLTRLSDGSLFCTFKAGPEKLSPRDRLWIMKSTDGGRTWRPQPAGFDTTRDGVPGSLTCGYITELSPGRLILDYLWVDRSDPARPLANPETTGVLPFKLLLAESADGGSTWGPSRHVSLWPHRGASQTGEILRLANGQLLLPYESWKEWDDVEGIQSANLRLSRDEGQTWSRPVVMAHDPFQDFYFWDNRLAVDPKTGAIVALFWTYNTRTSEDVDIHIGLGSPDGEQWTVRPRPTGIRGQIAAPIILPGKRLLMFYVHRHDPGSMRAVLSEDLGRTWRVDDELIVYRSGGGRESGMAGGHSEAEYWEDMYRWTFGHPKGVALDDRHVLLAFYGGDKDHMSIHWAKVDVA